MIGVLRSYSATPGKGKANSSDTGQSLKTLIKYLAIYNYQCPKNAWIFGQFLDNI